MAPPLTAVNLPPFVPYQQPTMQANYSAALSMENDDDDNITVVTFNTAVSKKSDDTTTSRACPSNDDMSDDE